MIINYTRTFKAINKHIDSYNLEKESKERVKANMIHTTHQMIKLYAINLIELSRKREVDPLNLPPLRTNNIQLHRLTTSSARTIQRHINRLKEAGVIQQKTFKGTSANYEIVLNPDLLVIKGSNETIGFKVEQELIKARKNQEEAVLKSSSKTTKCPLDRVTSTSTRNNKTLIAVNNSAHDTTGNDQRSFAKKQNESLKTTGNQTGYTGGKDGAKVPPKVGQNDIYETGGKDSSNGLESTKSELLGVSEARSASLHLYVDMLWMLAKNVLYKDIYLTERQSEEGKNKLFQWYEPVSTESLMNVHQIYVSRIDLVKKYIAKDPQRRFVQLPIQYFEPTNPNGFTGTKAWYQKEQERKQQVHKKRTTYIQINRLKKNDLKPNHEQVPKLQLYKECESIVERLNEPVLLAQFHKAVLNPTAINN